MSKIKYFLQQSWLLMVSAFCFGLLIALANTAWSGIIEQNKIEKLNRLMGGLMPRAKRFKMLHVELRIKSPRGKEMKTKIYKGLSDANEILGWAFRASGPGFQDKIELVVAVNKSFDKFAGFAVLASNETPNFGDRIKNDYFQDQFEGAPVSRLELNKSGDEAIIDSEIISISGATVSSESVVKIINNTALQLKKLMREKRLLGDGR
jgi:electron transport complex protein RnfG